MPWLSALILAIIATVIGTTNPLDMGDNWLHRLHTVAFLYGYYCAWLLMETKDKENKLVKKTLKEFRTNANAVRLVLIAISFCSCRLYVITYNSKSLNNLTSFFGQGFYVEQFTSIVIMIGLIVIFSLKN